MSRQPPKLAATLATFEKLTADHDTVVAEIEAAAAELDTCKAALRDAGSAVYHAEQIAKRRAGNLTEDALARHVAADAEVKHARKERDRAQRALADLESRIATLESRRDEVFMKRYALRGGTLGEVLEHQEQLAAAEAEVTDLESRIAALRAAPAPDLPDLSEIEGELSAALAQSELGNGDPATVAKLEKQRASALKEREQATQAADRAALLLRGLESRLEEARAEVARLEQLGRVATTWHLLTELEQAGKDYGEQAAKLIETYGRMIGLSRALEHVDASRARGVSLRHLSPLTLPLPNLEALNGSDLKGWRDDADFQQAAAREELERLRGAGLRLI